MHGETLKNIKVTLRYYFRRVHRLTKSLSLSFNIMWREISDH